jgi:anti-sigma factor RsiW
MSTVPEPDDRLSGYLDGELTPGERAAIDDFLARSDTWRGALADVQWARNTVRALPWREAPAGLWDDVALEGLGATAPHRWRHPFRVLAGAAAAAAVAAAFLVPLEERETAGGGGSQSQATTVTSVPDRSTVQSNAAAQQGDTTGVLEDVLSVCLDPFDW